MKVNVCVVYMIYEFYFNLNVYFMRYLKKIYYVFYYVKFYVYKIVELFLLKGIFDGSCEVKK